MTINKKIAALLLAFVACTCLLGGWIFAAVLAADDVTLPEGATFYYQYVITDADYEAGARFDESYLESVQTKIKNGGYVENTIVGIERSADQRTMTIYMGSAAGTVVEGVLQPYEEAQPAVKVENSALAELEGWTDSNSIQTLSSGHYIGSAVQTYGQKNTTFTSSLKLKYGFTYTLTLGEGQSIDEVWYSNARAAIDAKTESGVLAIEKSEDGKTYTMYFDAYYFYKTTLSLPSVTLTDTSTQVFGSAWTDGGSNTLSTDVKLSSYFAYDYDAQSYGECATNLSLTPSLVTKTYDLYIDVSSGGSLADVEDYSKYVSGSGSGYTVSKTNDGMLLVEGVQAEETISLNTNVIDVNSGKLLSGFSMNESSTDSGVSCTISYEASKWKFGFASTDTNASHAVYVDAVYSDTAQMYVELASGAKVDQSGIDGSADIVSVDSSYSNDGYLILTVRDGAVISFADILIYDGYYTTDTATAGQDGTSQSSIVTVAWIEITAATVTTIPTANTLTYTGSAQALVTAGAADGGALYYSLTNTDGSWSLSVPTATDAGNYTVYYKVIGDAYHNDVDPTLVPVTINKADAAVTAPTAVSGLTYTGAAQELITAGETSDGTLMYKLSTANEYSTAIPSATEAGTYIIYYIVKGDSNHSDTAEDRTFVTVTIAKKSAEDIETPTPSAVTYSPTQTLGDIALTGGWVWADDTIVPQVGNSGYTACYDVTGYANYDWTNIDGYNENNNRLERTITLTVNASQLATPTGLTWSGNTASWDAADNASGYLVQLYKDGTAEGSAISVTGTSTTFSITEAGSYTFTVTAVGTGNYSSSATSAASGALVYYTVTWKNDDTTLKTDVVQSGATPSYSGDTPTKTTDGTYIYAFSGWSPDVGAITADTAYTAQYSLTYVAPATGAGCTIDYSAETATAASGYEISTDGSAWSSTLTVTPSGTLYVRRAADSNASASAETTNTLASRPTAPSVTAVNEQWLNENDGQITGVTTAMEYSTNGSTWTACTGTTVDNLAAGTYYVRYTATSSAFASEATSVTIASGTARTYTLTVTAPTFAAVTYGYTQPEAASITITSSGNSDAAITSVTVSSANFTISGSGTTVTAGGTNTGYTIRPVTGLAADTYTATITVTYTDGAEATDTVSFTVGKATPSVTAPEAQTLTYTGGAQELVSAGSTTGGTMYYSTDNESWGTDIPQGTDANTYAVYYKVVGDSNYSDTAVASVDVTIAKASAAATAPTAADSLTYTGAAQALVTAGSATGGTLNYSLTGDEWSVEIPTATDAGEYTVYYKAVGDSNHSDTAVASVDATIAKASATATAPTAVGSLTYTGAAQALVTAGTATGGTLNYSLTGSDWSAEIPTATDAGEYTVYYKAVGDSNHEDTTAASVSVTIAKASATVTAPTAADSLTYTGAAQALVTAGSATGGTLNYSLTGDDWNTEIPTATEAGEYTVYYKAVGDSNHEDTAVAGVSVTIAKASAAATAPTAADSLTYTGAAQELVTAGSATGGTLNYSLTGSDWSTEIPTATEAGEYTVYYKAVGDSNHEDTAAASVSVTVAKASAAATAPTAVSGLTYTGTAQVLVSAGTATGGTLNYSLTGDDWSAEIPTATDAGEYTVYYKAVGDSNHEDTAAASVSVTIAKAAQDAPEAPTLASATTSSVTLTSISANANGAEAEYSIDGTAWQSGATFTGLSSGTTFTVYVRYAETENYSASAAASASVSTNRASSGSHSGSSSSSTTTSTSTNNDGSTTTTVTNTSTGAVTETTEYTDGSTVTVVTDGRTGTVTETTVQSDGTVTETVTDGETGTVTSVTERADGSTVVAVTDGETGIKTTTETTADNVVIVTVAEPEANVAATITVPDAVDVVTVTIPAEISSGTVAINADTGEIVMLSVPTEDGMLVTLESSANIILVDNSKDFTDTEDHWAEDAIDFVTAREIFNGTGDSAFAPDEDMTRGMLAQVLHNLAGNPAQTYESIYADIAETDWYSSAVGWASAAGLISGYGDVTYGANDAVTREQVATILYRYAQYIGCDVSVGENANVQSYSDHEQVSEYADEAIRWAVAAELIQGTDEGNLNPQGSATRAQIAAILQRFVANVTM